MPISEPALRKRAIRKGLSIKKFREDSRWFDQYGPYALVDVNTNRIEVFAIERDELETVLAKWSEDR